LPFSPEKGSEPRQLKISLQLIAMLNSLPREKDAPFACSHRHFDRYFRSQRANVAKKLKNDRIRKITFHTLRHWKATMEYARTKDLLPVQQVLGHRSILSTMIYINLIDFREDSFHTATAKTVEEAAKLVEIGFEYICDYEGIKLFKKRK